MWATLPHINDDEVLQINEITVSFSKLEEFNTANGDDWVQYI